LALFQAVTRTNDLSPENQTLGMREGEKGRKRAVIALSALSLLVEKLGVWGVGLRVFLSLHGTMSRSLVNLCWRKWALTSGNPAQRRER